MVLSGIRDIPPAPTNRQSATMAPALSTGLHSKVLKSLPMPANDNIQLGTAGEAAAVQYLESCGFKIIETDFRTKQAQIDIIAEDQDFVCFIEVKTRRSLKKGLPRESVNLKKQKKIVQGALFYIKNRKLGDSRIRFDVVEVFYTGNSGFDFNLIKNAFQPG